MRTSEAGSTRYRCKTSPLGPPTCRPSSTIFPPSTPKSSRPLSIAHAYQEWTNLIPSNQFRQLLADGAIPLIDWGCGDSDANIVAGRDDALITGFAQELAALQAPVFLRWYYEPNFPGSANYQNCIGSGGPAGYVQAWRHIHNLFMAAGATNVAFVWAIALAGDQTGLTSYYPGSAYVDWIGADGYYRAASIAAAQDAFAGKFSEWYSEFASSGKPLIVSETGAFAGSQAQYLQEIANDLPIMPAIKAVAYFDAPAKSGTFPYALDTAGVQAFAALSRMSYFLPERDPSTVSVTASPGRSHHGEQVRLTATIGADLGGTVSYSVDGVPIAGCQSLPISISYSCGTTALPPGTHMVTAAYSGDAEFAPAASAPLAATVTPAAPAVPPSKPARSPRPTRSPPSSGSRPGTPSAGSQPAFLLGTGNSGSISPMPAASISVPVVAPVAPLAAVNIPMPRMTAPRFATNPPPTVGTSTARSQSPSQEFQFAAKALASPFRLSGWVLLGLVIVVGLCGYIGGTWIIDHLARRRRRERL